MARANQQFDESPCWITRLEGGLVGSIFFEICAFLGKNNEHIHNSQ